MVLGDLNGRHCYPLHHRMERSITNMLVSKNNRVRLAAAKRTIEELEGASGA